MNKRLSSIILVALAVLVFGGAPVYAQATRTWVSGVGDDANPCSRTAPCKTFAGAIAKTATGGEINVLDPGGFGAITITKPITISSQGFEGGVLVSGTNGMVVAVPNPNDTVIIRGLDIEGLGTGINGVLVNTGGNVTVENCTINNFNTAGINYAPTVAGSHLHVSNTIVRNNGTLPSTGQGINLAGTAAVTATLDHVRMEHNIVGVQINNASLKATATGCIAANNVFAGFSAAASGSVFNLEQSVSTHNATGVGCGAGTAVRLGNMNISDNTTAVTANCFTYKNNDVDQIVTMTLIGQQ